jgi:ABC-2 type transport system ATP-binding protein
MPTRISFTLQHGDGRPAGAGARHRTVIETADPLGELARIADWAETCGVRLRDLDVRRPSLEDVYLQLTAE